MGLALLVSEAAKHRDAGFSAAQIAGHATMLSQKIRFFAAINTLKYLRKGGRISAATAFVGELLGMKPIVSIINGCIHLAGKAKGLPEAIKVILQKVLSDLPDLRYGVAFSHSCSLHLVENAIKCMKEPLGLTEWLICNIGSVIGTYVGRGGFGFAYIAG